MDKKLNIVSLNIPWPADYGGVIDIYYKIKALNECGIKIILHCFEYERPRAPELETVCEKCITTDVEQVFYRICRCSRTMFIAVRIND